MLQLQQWRENGFPTEQNQRFDYSRFSGKRINILAPVIRARKGHYGTFQQIAKQGFLKVRVNGDVLDITLGMKLDRYKTHDIELCG
jgi:excinuclease ABC subunit A